MKTEKFRGWMSVPPLWFCIVCTLAILSIFWEPLFSGLFIWGPDSSSFVYAMMRSGFPLSYLGYWDSLHGLGTSGFTQPMLPYHLVSSLAPALLIKPILYIGSVLVAVLAGFYFLRGRNVGRWPAAMGGLALGLTAHTYSLISAGHDNKIHAWPFWILMLAGVDRGVTRRSFFNFILAGYAAGVAFALTPDISLLFAPLVCIFGLYLFLRTWPGGLGAQKTAAAIDTPAADAPYRKELRKLRWRHVIHTLLGGLAAATIAVCVSLSGLIFALGVVLPDRAVLASATGTTSNTKQSKWEFATNWSLPPAEILEFVAPCIFGIQSGDPNGPYWGKLGRTLGWEQHHRGLMNLRQHTVYLGVIQLVFAVFAVIIAVAALRRRRREPKEGLAHVAPDFSKTEGGRPSPGQQIPALAESSVRETDILFWAGAFVVAVMLALGRNFPLYRLFYELVPYGDSVRAPVKMLHLAEVSLCFLFAFGLDAFLSRLAEARESDGQGVQEKVGKKQKAQPRTAKAPEHRNIWRTFGFGCAGIGILFLIGTAFAASQKADLAELWTGYGMGGYADALMRLMSGSLVHAAVLFFVCAAAFLLATYSSWRRLPLAIPAILVVILAVDTSSVLKRYVTVWDEYERFAPTEILSGLQADRADYRVSMPVKTGIYEVWHKEMFAKRWITLLDAEDRNSLSTEDKTFFSTLAQMPLRLWQLTSTKNIIAPSAALAQLAKAPAVETVSTFDIMRDGSVQHAPLGKGQQSWLRITNVLPRAAVYSPEYVQSNAWTARLADPAWNPQTTAIVVGSGAAQGKTDTPREPAEIVSYKPNRVQIEASSTDGGVLMLNDRYDPKWEAFLDGKAVPVLRCNGVMRGVAFPAGRHQVVFLYRPYIAYFLLNAGATALFACWAILRLIRSMLHAAPSQA